MDRRATTALLAMCEVNALTPPSVTLAPGGGIFFVLLEGQLMNSTLGTNLGLPKTTRTKQAAGTSEPKVAVESDGVPEDSLGSTKVTESAPKESSLRQAFVKVGKAVAGGGLLGFSVALAAAGAAAVAPALGVAVAGGLLVAGGIQGAVTFGDSAAELTGNKTMGKFVGAATGAGMTALCMGLGPAASVPLQAAKGWAMGALFGLITSAKSG